MTNHARVVVTTICFALAGCAERNDSAGQVPAPAADELGATSYSVTSKGWTATAFEPWVQTAPADLGMGATFEGTGTRRMGACLFRKDPNDVACSNDGECYGVPVPMGGELRCMAAGGQTQGYCYVRPGTEQDFCVGSPADPLKQPISESYQSRYVHDEDAYWRSFEYLTRACFEGCSTTDPAISSSTTTAGCTGDWGSCQPY